MNSYPRYLVDYPKMASTFPFYMKYERFTGHTPHRSDFLVLILIVDGTGTHTVNGRTYPAQRGTLTFLMPYQIHHLRTSDKESPITMYVCNFDMDLLFGMEREAESLSRLLFEPDEQVPYVQLYGEYKERMLLLFKEMHNEYEKVDPWSEIIVRSKLFEVLARFDRLRKVGKVQSVAGKLSPEPILNDSETTAALIAASPAIWHVIHYIHTHYREPLSLQRLAERFHFHPVYLSESFKRHVGLTFLHFLHEVRIRNACGLLITTRISITDIAAEVGFNSLNTFMRVFRQQKGCTPSAFRKQIRREVN